MGKKYIDAEALADHFRMLSNDELRKGVYKTESDIYEDVVDFIEGLPGVDIHEISKRECTTLFGGGVMLTEQFIETVGTKRFGFIREKLERDLGKALFRKLIIEEERCPEIQSRVYRAKIRVWNEGKKGEEDEEND